MSIAKLRFMYALRSVRFTKWFIRKESACTRSVTQRILFTQVDTFTGPLVLTLICTADDSDSAVMAAAVAVAISSAISLSVSSIASSIGTNESDLLIIGGRNIGHGPGGLTAITRMVMRVLIYDNAYVGIADYQTNKLFP